METNVNIVNPVFSVMKFIKHKRSDKLESEIIDINEVKNRILDLEDRTMIFGFDSSSIKGKKKDVLKFINENFKEDKTEAVIAKHDKYDVNGIIKNYIHLYKEGYLLKTDNQIIFLNIDPLRGKIIYFE